MLAAVFDAVLRPKAAVIPGDKSDGGHAGSTLAVSVTCANDGRLSSATQGDDGYVSSDADSVQSFSYPSRQRSGSNSSDGAVSSGKTLSRSSAGSSIGVSLDAGEVSSRPALVLKRRRARKLSVYAKHLGLDVVFDPIVTPVVTVGKAHFSEGQDASGGSIPTLTAPVPAQVLEGTPERVVEVRIVHT